MISIIIPSRDRPVQLCRAIDNVRATTGRQQVEIIIVLDDPDTESQELMLNLPVRVIVMPPTYVHGNPQQKFQAGYEASLGDWIVSGSDDVLFCDGWLEAALSWPNRGFVGLREEYFGTDLAVLVMASRDYIETIMHGEFGLPYYHSWFADVEWRERALAVGAFTVCPEARFQHLHWVFKRAEHDSVYAIGEQFHRQDERTFELRQKNGWPKEPV